MVRRPRVDYSGALRRAQAAAWDLQQAIDAIDLDFGKPFLPENLACNNALGFLDDDERRVLNQIQGHAYAHLFAYVEEFIISQSGRLAAAAPEDSLQEQALQCLQQQERKHQRLFLAFRDAFSQAFPTDCRYVGDQQAAAMAICEHSPLAVMLLMTMLEWVTQRHYLIGFKRRANGLDPGFGDLFRLHWIEEAHHTTVDNLELESLAASLAPGQRESCFEEFLGLCELLEYQLKRQAELDAENLSNALERTFSEEQVAQLRSVLAASYCHMFLGLGLSHPVFLSEINELLPGRDGDLLRLGQRYVISTAGDDPH